MIKRSTMLRFLSLTVAVAGFVFASGYFTQASAQTGDPFRLPDWKRPKGDNSGGKGGAEKKGPPPVVAVMPPSIEQRISYYKQLREAAALNGNPIPKVTTVLTLDEMQVTGIFRTPRGYAAMVEATPIKLSYTIYPGEKFFDGQLVAVEENRLVFRKVTKMSNGKLVSSVENKILRQYSAKEEIQGTAPVESSGRTETVSAGVQTESKQNNAPVAPTVIVSPLDEMNKQPQTQPDDSKKEKSNKKNTKPVRVAKKS